MRLQVYKKILKDIYGSRVVNQLTKISEENQTLSLIDNKMEINKFIKSYDRRNGEGCEICKNKIDKKTNQPIFRKDFLTRIMDFPSWHPEKSLNFKENNHAKKIMIIGEAPSPKIQRQINIAYELGRYPINHDGTIDMRKEKDEGIKKQVKYNNLWKYLGELFPGRLEYVKENCYITDICKCNDDIKNEKNNISKNMKIWEVCSKNYLFEEFKSINPKLVIFQGNTAHEYLKKLEKKYNSIKINEEKLKEKYNFSRKEYAEDFLGKNFSDFDEEDFKKIPKNFPKFGTIKIDNTKEIHFLKIFHTAKTATHLWTRDNSKTIYFKLYIDLIKERIFPLLNLR